MDCLYIILNLILIECLLSVDNAAVLATMVAKLPQVQQSKALKYGMLGAYLFRGICMLAASYILKVWWLKPLGGLYLIWLAYSHFKDKQTVSIDDDYVDKSGNTFGFFKKLGLNEFWSTVIIVEIMDLAFSLDNVLAAVAFTDNIWVVCTGVFIGILAMRFVSQFFVTLMARYSFLETVAFLVIAVLGIKLSLSAYTHFADNAIAKWLESEHADMLVSLLTIAMFFVPVIYMECKKRLAN